MARKAYEKLTIRNAETDYYNFAGKANDYNSEGCRNFCLIIDDLELVQKMIEDHWNMKPYKPSLNESTGEYEKYYTQVNVAYGSDFYPDPSIVYVSDGGRKQTVIDEAMLDIDSEISPDKLYFSRIDVTVRLNRSINKRTKEPQTKGYLMRMYAWLEEDELKREYDDLLYGDTGTLPEDDAVPFDEE